MEPLHEGAQARVQDIEAGFAGGVVGLLQFQHQEVVDPVRGDLVGLSRGAGAQRNGPQILGAVGLAATVEGAARQRSEFGEDRFQRRPDN